MIDGEIFLKENDDGTLEERQEIWRRNSLTACFKSPQFFDREVLRGM